MGSLCTLGKGKLDNPIYSKRDNMTKTFAIITISVVTLISGSAYAGWEKIKTEAEINTLIVEKHLIYKTCDIVLEKMEKCRANVERVT